MHAEGSGGTRSAGSRSRPRRDESPPRRFAARSTRSRSNRHRHDGTHQQAARCPASASKAHETDRARLRPTPRRPPPRMTTDRSSSAIDTGDQVARPTGPDSSIAPRAHVRPTSARTSRRGRRGTRVLADETDLDVEIAEALQRARRILELMRLIDLPGRRRSAARRHSRSTSWARARPRKRSARFVGRRGERLSALPAPRRPHADEIERLEQVLVEHRGSRPHERQLHDLAATSERTDHQSSAVAPARADAALDAGLASRSRIAPSRRSSVGEKPNDGSTSCAPLTRVSQSRTATPAPRRPRRRRRTSEHVGVLRRLRQASESRFLHADATSLVLRDHSDTLYEAPDQNTAAEPR